MRQGFCSVALLLASGLAWASQDKALESGPVDIQRVKDLNHDGVIDGADVGLALLGEEIVPGLEQEAPPMGGASMLAGTGAQGLFGNTYIVDVAGTRYSVMDVYIKWGSAIGTGSSGERVVAIFGQSVTDVATGNVDKTATYQNSAGIAFQHLNTSWLPGSASGASTWDSFLTIGCRTQGGGNSANVTADPFFLNPSAATAAGVATVTGGSDQLTPPRFVGAGVYQAAPTHSGWETNVGTFSDSMILIGRFTVKVSDIIASGGPVTMRVRTNFTGKSTAQSGGSTLYTISAANLKSDAQTTYTASGQTWTFNSTFQGTDVGQQAWTFASTTLFVPSQYATIQAAIDAAPSSGGWTIAVAPGTYNEAIDLKGKAIMVKATGARASTIIDGTGKTTSVVRAVSGETSATVLQGFTVRNGPVGSPVGTYRLGGGIYVDNSSPTIRDCTFTNNTAAYGGGIYGLYSNSLLENCTFSQNVGSTDGGGVQFYGGSPVIRNCVISNNACMNNGGGTHLVQVATGGAPTLDSCTITGNTTSNGNGGGVSIYGPVNPSLKPTVQGCSISGNTATNLGGGLFSAISAFAPTRNAILSGNTICANTSIASKRENVWALFDDLGNTICDCMSDVDGNGIVDNGDLALTLLFVGELTDPNFIQSDQDMSGFIDIGDVALLLLNFGPCS